MIIAIGFNYFLKLLNSKTPPIIINAKDKSWWSAPATKTISVNLANTENVAGATFKLSYDANKLYVKSIRTASRTSNMQLIRNGNEFTFIKQDGSQTIPKGTGAIAYIDVTAGKTGFDTSSLKITEVKAANPKANKISVKIETSSTGVKNGVSLT